PKPAPAPASWRGLIGEYGPDKDILIVLEQDGNLYASKHGILGRMLEQSRDNYEITRETQTVDRVIFIRDVRGRATKLTLSGQTLKRRNIEPESGNQLRVKPLRPVAELMKEALAAQPPYENVHFLVPDLVELRKLDPSIRLEIRYATTNN